MKKIGTELRVTPIITEKSLANAKKGKFTFAVNLDARKPTIKQAVEKTFSVKVVKIATNIIKGKKKRTGPRRVEKEEQVWKKAIVQVASGQTIAAFGLSGK